MSRRTTNLEVAVESAMRRYDGLRRVLSTIAAAKMATADRLRELAKETLDRDDQDEEL